jgi:hypothetical protein
MRAPKAACGDDLKPAQAAAQGGAAGFRNFRVRPAHGTPLSVQSVSSRRHPAVLLMAAEASAAELSPSPVGEARWPAAGAVLAAIVLTVLLPDGERVGPGWLLPAIELVLLAAIVAGDPGRISRRSRLLRGLSIALVTVLVLGALSSTLLLIDALIHGDPETNSASALLYWELDGGGAAARAYRLPRHPHFAFPQQQNPALAPPGWRPRFVDYLYLGFTNALAFSPTDVMSLVPWAKVAMAVQSLISMGILALVVARAVNVFT